MPRFFSDNAAPVHPKVMEAVAAANVVDSAYDGDRWSRRLDEVFSTLFERQVAVLWMATGTAANSLGLAALVKPHQAVICHREAHIEMDEAGAPGFFTGGAKLLLLDGPGAKITPQAIESKLACIRKDVHQVQAAAISITNATECGLIYRPEEVAALGAVARAHGLGCHMDGARFANAVASLGCHPAEVTWKGGVDVLSFGCVKNGGMNAEALIFFDPGKAEETHYRRKRSGHLQSKGRYLAAQILALLENDLWLENASMANAAAQTIAAASAERLLYPVEANEIFLRLTQVEAERLRAAGFEFYDWGEGVARLVTSWHQSGSEVKRLAGAIAAL